MWAQSAREIGSIIVTARRHRKLTQQQVAKAVGASQHWLSEIEQGKDTAPIGKVLRVLSHLGVRLQVGEAPWLAASGADPTQSPVSEESLLSRIVATHSDPPARRKRKR